MKKVFVCLFCSLCFLNIYKADCDYKAIREINTLASYVEYSYKFDETSERFLLTFINVPDSLYIQLNGINRYPQDGILEIKDLEMGQTLDGYIVSKEYIACANEYLRPIKITLPYLNPYFGTSECIGHENLEVCSHQFLNYQISYYTFHKLLNDNIVNVKGNETKPDEIVKEKTFLETILEYGKIIGIPLLLVLVTSLLTFSVCNVIYRKIKHGL